MNQLTLTAPHPYYPSLGEVTLTVPLLDGPPGIAICNLGKVSMTALRQPDVWTPLTTDFRISGDRGLPGRIALMALLWDLTGQPIHPRLGARRAGSFRVVLCEGRRVEVWRPTVELRFSADEKAIRERESHVNDLVEREPRKEVA